MVDLLGSRAELNVSEGKVRVKRLSDGREVDVPAKHRVIAGDEREMTPKRVPDSINHWKSQLDLGPTKAWGIYGKHTEATNIYQGKPMRCAILLGPKNS